MRQILIDLNKCLGCKSCEIACAVNHSESRNLFGALSEKNRLRPRVLVEAGQDQSFPVQCRHCDEARCVQACMTGSMSKDPVTGIVLNNSERCVGCWMCVMVCPFGAIVTDKSGKKALKCDRCIDSSEPACVRACPTSAMKIIDVDDFSKTVRKQYLTKFHLSEEEK